MALSVDDVKKIVDSKIGGMTLTPAPTTFIEGRVVTPQIPTLCSAKSSFEKLAGDAGKALGEMKDAFGKAVDSATGAFNDLSKEISGAIGEKLTGAKDFLLNPLKAVGDECKAALTSAMADIQAKIAELTATGGDPGMIASLQAALADLQASMATVTGAMDQAAKMVGEKFQEVMAACSMCKPDEMPGVKQYAPTDFTKTLDQADNLANIKLQASSIVSAASSMVAGGGTAAQAAFDSARSSMSSLSSTVSSAVANDVANLSGAQAQNEAMGQFMQVASGLNNDGTKDFLLKVVDPSSRDLLGRAQVGLANVGKVADVG